MNDFVVSSLKYRPKSFETVVGQDHVTGTLKNSIKENRPNVDDKLRRKPFTYPQTWSKGSQKELDSRDLFTTKN